MNRLLIAILLTATASLTYAQQKFIKITNPLNVQRPGEIVEIPWSEINKYFPALDTANFKIINAKTKEEYVFQLEQKGLNEIQNLLVQVDLAPNNVIKLQLVKGPHRLFASKTFCRYVPERKDDFAWENDKIAFRMYGKELENTPKEMAYGVDVWVKRSDKLVLNERYKRGEYHVDHGDGMDYYHVGLTLGAGGIAPYINDSLWFPKNYREWKVLDNGPLRSTFQLGYEEWVAGGITLKATKTISLDAGSQFSKAVIQFQADDDKPLPVAIGIIKREEPGEMLLNENNSILAYWEPRHGKDGTTGVGCILTTPVKQMQVKKGHLIAETIAPANGPIVYYHGAAWDKAGVITNSKQWFNYISQKAELLQSPVKVELTSNN